MDLFAFGSDRSDDENAAPRQIVEQPDGGAVDAVETGIDAHQDNQKRRRSVDARRRRSRSRRKHHRRHSTSSSEDRSNRRRHKHRRRRSSRSSSSASSSGRRRRGEGKEKRRKDERRRPHKRRDSTSTRSSRSSSFSSDSDAHRKPYAPKEAVNSSAGQHRYSRNVVVDERPKAEWICLGCLTVNFRTRNSCHRCCAPFTHGTFVYVQDDREIYINRIPMHWTDAQLKADLVKRIPANAIKGDEGNDVIEQVEIPRDGLTRSPRGFAFVAFKDAAVAKLFLETWLGGRVSFPGDVSAKLSFSGRTQLMQLERDGAAAGSQLSAGGAFDPMHPANAQRHEQQTRSSSSSLLLAAPPHGAESLLPAPFAPEFSSVEELKKILHAIEEKWDSGASASEKEFFNKHIKTVLVGAHQSEPQPPETQQQEKTEEEGMSSTAHVETSADNATATASAAPPQTATKALDLKQRLRSKLEEKKKQQLEQQKRDEEEEAQRRREEEKERKEEPLSKVQQMRQKLAEKKKQLGAPSDKEAGDGKEQPKANTSAAKEAKSDKTEAPQQQKQRIVGATATHVLRIPQAPLYRSHPKVQECLRLRQHDSSAQLQHDSAAAERKKRKENRTFGLDRLLQKQQQKQDEQAKKLQQDSDTLDAAAAATAQVEKQQREAEREDLIDVFDGCNDVLHVALPLDLIQRIAPWLSNPAAYLPEQ